ncbi:MAG: FKBP-type peptidyl-prolyl cis-trans isomerase [Rikenellaceae bacterium]
MSLKYQEYKERNREFMDEFRRRDGVRELWNGVLYREITKGKGVKPNAKSIVLVHYRGTLINGKRFDSTMDGGKPARFKLNELIDGWKTALKEMQVGSHWQIVIPFNLGYGSRGAGAIKPYSTLIFEVQLLGVS